MSDTKYNGYANYNTWNCAHWIQIDPLMYLSASLFMRHYLGRHPYREWVKVADLQEKQTLDNCNWLDGSLELSELDSMMEELMN